MVGSGKDNVLAGLGKGIGTAMTSAIQNLYHASSIDWPRLRSLAKRTAQETLAVGNESGWQLDSLNWISEERTELSDSVETRTEYTDYFYMLGRSGELTVTIVTWQEAIAHGRYFASEKKATSSPMSDNDIMHFDFDDTYQEFQGNNTSQHGTRFFARSTDQYRLKSEKKGDGLESKLNHLLSQSFQGYSTAAQKGVAQAQHSLGACYAKGLGVAQDLSQAHQWFHLAADQGYAAAQYELGLCHFKGAGVPKNEAQALQWFESAARNNHAAAQQMIGHCHFHGKAGLKKNTHKAVALYKLAAASGDSDALCALGEICQEGLDGPRDVEQAIQWYTKSSSLGNAYAKEKLEHIHLRRRAEKRRQEITATLVLACGILFFSIWLLIGMFGPGQLLLQYEKYAQSVEGLFRAYMRMILPSLVYGPAISLLMSYAGKFFFTDKKWNSILRIMNWMPACWMILTVTLYTVLQSQMADMGSGPILTGFLLIPAGFLFPILWTVGVLDITVSIHTKNKPRAAMSHFLFLIAKIILVAGFLAWFINGTVNDNYSIQWRFLIPVGIFGLAGILVNKR